MRALILDQTAASPARRLRLVADYPDPVAPPGESLVHVRLAGICGTDLEQLDGYMGFSGIPGHEFVGEVIRSANHALRGKRVVGEINAACGSCDVCRAGLGRHCPNRTVLGIERRDGTFAQFLSLPDSNLLPIPDALPDEVAIFTEPLAAAFEIFEQTSIAPGQRIAILGDGRLGTLVAMAMRARGLPALVGGHHDYKLGLLTELGLDTQREERLEPGYDVVVDCSGSAAGLARAIDLVRPRGKLILKTTIARYGELNLAPIVINEIEVLGSRCGRFAPALAALSEGKVDPRPLLTATYPLEEAAAALKHAAQADVFKVLLKVA